MAETVKMKFPKLYCCRNSHFNVLLSFDIVMEYMLEAKDYQLSVTIFGDGVACVEIINGAEYMHTARNAYLSDPDTHMFPKGASKWNS